MFCSYFLFDDDFVKERFNSHLGRFTKQKTQPVLDRIYHKYEFFYLIVFVFHLHFRI